MGHNKYAKNSRAMNEPPAHENKSPFIPKFNSTSRFEVTTLPNGWAVAILKVNPELATEMLQRNSSAQRSMKKSAIDKYAWDMMEGNWHLTHQGLAFDDAGTLYDGQNRLSAVITSGATVEMLVFFGVGRIGKTKEMLAIDTHKARDVKDASKIGGGELTRRTIVIFNSMIRFGIINGNAICSKMSHQVRLDEIEKKRVDLETLVTWIGSTKLALKITNGAVAGAMACAMYHVDREKLKRFVLVLTEQSDPEPGEGIAKVLRQYIQSRTGGYKGEDLFLKTCKAIQHFVVGKEVKPTGLFSCHENPFIPPDIKEVPY